MTEALSLEYVQKHRTKTQSRGWKVVCPSCGGNDLWYTPDNNRAFCFECGYVARVGEQDVSDYDDGGKVVFDVPRIRELYAQAHWHYRESLSPGHREYLQQRGIDSGAVDRFAIGYCPRSSFPVYEDPLARDAGFFDMRGSVALSERIVFPYIADSQITDLRGRTTQKDVEPKYRSLSHRSAHRGAIFPFNYARAMEMAREQKLVIVTEGEIKAIVADLHGFPCVGLPGMLAWKPGLITDRSIRTVVVFDSNRDPADRVRVDRALHRLSQRILGFDVVSLPLLGENKMDIDYYLLHKSGGYARFRHLVDSAVPYEMYRKLRRF